MSANKDQTNKVPSALAIGIARGGLEVKQFMRQRESVVFTIAFPIMLLAIFGSVFTNELTDGVTFSQYFVAGMIASGLVNTGFQQLAIMIPVERDFGTLKRLRGTPMPASSYFIGKSIVVFVTMVDHLGKCGINSARYRFLGNPKERSRRICSCLTRSNHSAIL